MKCRFAIIGFLPITLFVFAACKDDAVKPAPEPPLDPDEMIELITDTAWFDTCGCLEGTIIKTMYEKNVCFAFDTNIPNGMASVDFLQYSPNIDDEVRKVMESINYPYISCPMAGLRLNEGMDTYLICNFPADRFKNIKRPFVVYDGVIISGIVYQSSFTPPGPILPVGAKHDLFLTSFKMPQKYLIEGGK